MQPAPIMPSPVFEGSEKRLEVDFYLGSETPRAGLRALSRCQLEALLDKASCSVVSEMATEAFDAYVLSESSLMVYSTKLVLKTCGTTRLLSAVPFLLELADSIAMLPRRCKYSRASYLFPELQPDLYRCFSKESQFLDSHFGPMGGEGGSYILGDAANGLQWHIYVADAEASPQAVGPMPTYSLEVCMTELCPVKAAQFVRTSQFISAKHATEASGIRKLLRGSEIDDYVFEPCGYSMNGSEGKAFSTIHVTPEEAFSYASLELSGYPRAAIEPSKIVAQAAEIFGPGRLTVSLSVDEDLPACNWVERLAPPDGYTMQGSMVQRFNCGGCVVHYNLMRSDNTSGPGALPSSPSTVLDTVLFGSLAGEETDREGTMDGSSRSISPSPVDQLSAAALPPVLRKVAHEYNAVTLPSGSLECIEAHMRDLIEAGKLEDPLCIIDLGRVVRLFEMWRRELPRVTPFYAVKCLTDNALMATLAALGAGFDCASEQEMQAVMRLGVCSDRVVLANACKRPKDMRSAVALGVQLTTFDTESELQKLAMMFPNAAALLRIRADDPGARCILGNKYGAEPSHAAPLLKAAAGLGVKVVGVSFHVGSLATNPAVFEDAIRQARTIFDMGEALGFTMGVLDIGGGFSSACFGLAASNSIPAAVNKALDAHFPEPCRVRVISEPGRYFAEDAATLACMVFGVRDYQTPAGSLMRDYWITDGLYGSMNSLLYDHAVLAGVHPLRKRAIADSDLVPSNVFGPTCDGLDVVLKDYPLPVLKYQDWLVFPNMGAYTVAGACNFNGMGVSAANACYVYSLRE